MKIAPDTVALMAAAIATIDTEDRRAAYRAGLYPRAGLTKDLDRRYRWDLFWASHANVQLHDLEHVLDSHIDTALRQIVSPL